MNISNHLPNNITSNTTGNKENSTALKEPTQSVIENAKTDNIFVKIFKYVKNRLIALRNWVCSFFSSKKLSIEKPNSEQTGTKLTAQAQNTLGKSTPVVTATQQPVLSEKLSNQDNKDKSQAKTTIVQNQNGNAAVAQTKVEHVPGTETGSNMSGDAITKKNDKPADLTDDRLNLKPNLNTTSLPKTDKNLEKESSSSNSDSKNNQTNTSDESQTITSATPTPTTSSSASASTPTTSSSASTPTSSASTPTSSSSASTPTSSASNKTITKSKKPKIAPKPLFLKNLKTDTQTSQKLQKLSPKAAPRLNSLPTINTQAIPKLRSSLTNNSNNQQQSKSMPAQHTEEENSDDYSEFDNLTENKYPVPNIADNQLLTTIFDNTQTQNQDHLNPSKLQNDDENPRMNADSEQIHKNVRDARRYFSDLEKNHS